MNLVYKIFGKWVVLFSLELPVSGLNDPYDPSSVDLSTEILSQYFWTSMMTVYVPIGCSSYSLLIKNEVDAIEERVNSVLRHTAATMCCWVLLRRVRLRLCHPQVPPSDASWAALNNLSVSKQELSVSISRDDCSLSWGTQSALSTYFRVVPNP